jgi:lipopolysaccharide export system protein LptA
MKLNAFQRPSRIVLYVQAGLALVFSHAVFAQTGDKGFKADNFAVADFYPAPNQRVKRYIITGTEGIPQPGNTVLVKGLKIQTFPLNGPPGVPEMILEAPQCILDQNTGIANSPGHMQVRSGDGKLRLEGDGFLFHQDKTNMSLTLSNHVHTTIERNLLAQSATNESTRVTLPLAGTNAPAASNQFLQIYSDQFFFDRLSNLFNYTGHVHVDDVQMDLTSETMAIQRSTNNAINNIVADGSVVIIDKSTGGRTTGDHAVYASQDGRQLVQLTGHPHWEQKGSEATAKMFILDRPMEKTNNTFRAEGDAYLKLPRQSISQSGIMMAGSISATNSPIDTNKFVEIYSDAMNFQLPPTNGPIQTFRAEKNVIILDRDRKSRATGGQAYYDRNTGLLELTENPLWQVDQKIAKGGILVFNAIEKSFTARTNASLRIPATALGRSTMLSSSKPGAATNQFIEVLSSYYESGDGVLAFHGHVQSALADNEAVIATLDSETLKVAYTTNQLQSIVAGTNVYAHMLPATNALGKIMEKELKCDELVMRMRPGTNGLIEQIVADQNVKTIQNTSYTPIATSTNTPKPVRLTLNTDLMTANFLPTTNALEILTADKHVVITRNEVTAHGDQAVYTGTNEIGQLTGNAEIVLTNTTLTGEAFTLDQRLNKLFTRNYKMVTIPKTNQPALATSSKKP